LKRFASCTHSAPPARDSWPDCMFRSPTHAHSDVVLLGSAFDRFEFKDGGSDRVTPHLEWSWVSKNAAPLPRSTDSTFSTSHAAPSEVQNELSRPAPFCQVSVYKATPRVGATKSSQKSSPQVEYLATYFIDSPEGVTKVSDDVHGSEVTCLPAATFKHADNSSQECCAQERYSKCLILEISCLESHLDKAWVGTLQRLGDIGRIIIGISVEPLAEDHFKRSRVTRYAHETLAIGSFVLGKFVGIFSCRRVSRHGVV